MTPSQQEALDRFWLEAAEADRRVQTISRLAQFAYSYDSDKFYEGRLSFESLFSMASNTTSRELIDNMSAFRADVYIKNMFPEFVLEQSMDSSLITTREEYLAARFNMIAKYLSDEGDDALKSLKNIKGHEQAAIDTVKAIRDRIGLLASDDNANTFAKQAKALVWTSRVWLIALSLAVGFTGYYAANHLTNAPSAASVGDLIALLPKLLLASLAVYVIRFCNRSYQAAAAKSAEYKQKSNSFLSLDTFLSSIGDPVKRDDAKIHVAKDLLLNFAALDHSDNPTKALLDVNLWRKEGA